MEKTKVVIPAWVNHKIFGLFVVDLGSPPLSMNRTFLQPTPTGGVDSVTDVNRIPERGSLDTVYATLRIGTLTVVPVEPTLPTSGSHSPNAFLNHYWGNYSWVFAPRLGNIGLSVLRQFETIIDYTNKRLVLIRVDSAGKRMVEVPAYTPKWTTPLIDVSLHSKMQWWGIKVRPDNSLDTLNAEENTKTVVLDSGAHRNAKAFGHYLVGYPFLKAFGVVGLNHRAGQFTLYR